MDLSISFASLVKNNGGLFKSEKQAAFLSSKLFDGEYWVFDKCYNNTSARIFTCDKKGVVSVTKKNTKKGIDVFSVVWKREESYIKAVEVKNKEQQRKKVIGNRLNVIRDRGVQLEVLQSELRDQAVALVMNDKVEAARKINSVYLIVKAHKEVMNKRWHSVEKQM